MRIFIDTSAFLAILDADDKNHPKASESWKKLVLSSDLLVCHNYVLVETLALLQNRFGMRAVRVFSEDVLPVVHIEWIDETTHNTAINALITAAKRDLSLVDCVSFEIMRKLGIKTAFTFDSHFAKQGFNCIP